MAIEHAHRILDWHETLSKDELPPRWMWPFEDELKIWFEEVDEKRNEQHGDSGGEAVPMMANELTRGRRG